MLSQLLSADGLRVDVGSADSLVNEVVDEVEKRDCDVVVISILAPSSPRNSRLLRRRLRERFPDLPVIIGYWGALHGDRLERRFGLSDKDKLVTRLSDCVAAVRQAATALPADDDEADDHGGDNAARSQSEAAALTTASGNRN
jgi:hypothetical protein